MQQGLWNGVEARGIKCRYKSCCINTITVRLWQWENNCKAMLHAAEKLKLEAAKAA